MWFQQSYCFYLCFCFVWMILNRKPSAVCTTIAHERAIYSIDWCPYSSNELLSGSHDGYFKLWDCSDMTERFSHNLEAPVWKAKYMPLGKAFFVSCIKKPTSIIWTGSQGYPPLQACTLSHTEYVISQFISIAFICLVIKERPPKIVWLIVIVFCCCLVFCFRDESFMPLWNSEMIALLMLIGVF